MSVLATEALQVHPVALQQDLVGAEGREENILDGWVKVVLKEFPSNMSSELRFDKGK